MYQIISKNRANNQTAIVKTDKPLMTRDQADKLAVRCTMAESNPRVVYNVQPI